MFGQVRQLVHEADFGGEHGIGRILGQLGGAHIHDDHALAVVGERLVQGAQQIGGALAVGADHDTVRTREIADRRPLFEEFRIRYHVEFDVGAARFERLLNRNAHLVRGTHGHGRLGDHDLVFRHVFADRARDGEHVAKVRRAILVGRRADCDELEQAVIYALLGVRGELQTPRRQISLHHRFESRLVKGNLALLQTGGLALIHIDAKHMVAGIGKASAGDQAHVAGAEDGDPHS